MGYPSAVNLIILVVYLACHPAHSSPPGAVVGSTARQGIHRGELSLTLRDSGATLWFDQKNDRMVFAPGISRDRRAALSALLDAFFAAHGHASKYLFSGASETLVNRLALELSRDREWDARRGKAVSGRNKDALLRVLNRTVPFADLAEAWGAHGYTLHAASIENIFIGPWRELSPPPGAPADARVPVSFVIDYVAIREGKP